MSEALFQYRIRVSPKAKNPRLKVTLQHGLEVVIPKGYDDTKVPTILDRKKHWIRAALERVELNRKFLEPEPQWQLPSSITLAAIEKTWHLESRESEYPTVVVRETAPGRLLIFGKIDDEQACIEALQRWLLRQAKEALMPMLGNVSRTIGLQFGRVFIKRQRTRWASCSRNRAISLNAKLLFIDPELVSYCMTHELCHIAEMNHSRKFWSLLQYHSPNFRELDHRLRDEWKSLPRWLHRIY